MLPRSCGLPRRPTFQAHDGLASARSMRAAAPNKAVDMPPVPGGKSVLGGLLDGTAGTEIGKQMIELLVAGLDRISEAAVRCRRVGRHCGRSVRRTHRDPMGGHRGRRMDGLRMKASRRVLHG